MPIATVRGAKIHYQVIGDKGPWIALSPGGRRESKGLESIARSLAESGYRVLLHDRRNCGASDLVFDSATPEYEIWADDLYDLLGQLDARPAIIGGSSSGCRLSLLFALKYPDAVRALLLWRVTGGAYAANRLAQNYYGQYAEMARQGGMAAICESEHFAARITARPEHRAELMAMDPVRFAEIMEGWDRSFRKAAETPIIGASEPELRSIRVPTLIVPGFDKTHPQPVGITAHNFIAGSELCVVMTDEPKPGESTAKAWKPKEPELVSLFADFLKRKLAA
jgi:pimeloyl-ACP methyl ester carboxylesterase